MPGPWLDAARSNATRSNAIRSNATRSEAGRTRRRGLGCLGLVGLLAVLGWLMLQPMLRSMLYPAPPVPVPEPPASLTEVVLEGVDGETLIAWAGGMDVAADRPAVLVLHGNGENLGTMQRSGFFDRLATLDVPFLVLDYPGYGRSGGEPREESLVAAARESLSWLGSAFPDRPQVILGWSLGAGVAMQTASAGSETDLAGLILLSPWSRLADVAAVHFPEFLVRPVVAGRYDSVAAVDRITAPTLVVHGSRDRIIPVDQGRRLAEALKARSGRPGTQAQWVEIPTAGHNDLLAHDPPWREMKSFLDGLTSR